MIAALSPMDGFTDTAFRSITQKVFNNYKNSEDELYMFTEFMSADGYVHNPSGVVKNLLKMQGEYPVIAQIFSGNKENLVKTAIDIDKKYDFQGIELNIGCPSPKVMACGGGSGMLKDKKYTLETIKELSESISIPFSIKTRAALGEEDKDEQFEFIQEASKHCWLVSIHGRTYKQGHSGYVDWDFIYKIKEKLGDSCKIVGNGGIQSYEDGLDKLGNTDGIMIGQASMGNPWSLVNNNPDISEIKDIIKEHLLLNIVKDIYSENFPFEDNDKLENIGESDIEEIKKDILENRYDEEFRAIIEFRKHLFSYVKGFENSKELRKGIARIKTYEGIMQQIEEFFYKTS